MARAFSCQSSGLEHRHDLHRHRVGADARDDRAPPPAHGLKEGGELWLFFGARTPGELPYCGPLLKLPKGLVDVNLAYSRQPGQPKQYVQDLIRARGGELARLLKDGNSYIYICGLKAMEAGVDEAFAEICRSHGMDWSSVLPNSKRQAATTWRPIEPSERTTQRALRHAFAAKLGSVRRQ